MLTVLQTTPRSVSLYAFLRSMKTASTRKAVEPVAAKKGGVLRDLQGYIYMYKELSYWTILPC